MPMIGSVWAIVWGEIFLRRHLHSRYIKLTPAENHPRARPPRWTGKLSGPSNAVRSSLLPAATVCWNCSRRSRPCFMFDYLANMHCDLKSLAWRYCSTPRGILNGLCAHLKRSGQCSRYSMILTPHHRLPPGRTTCVF